MLADNRVQRGLLQPPLFLPLLESHSVHGILSLLQHLCAGNKYQNLLPWLNMFGYTIRIHVCLQRTIRCLSFLGLNSLYTNSLACVLDSLLAFPNYIFYRLPNPSHPLFYGIGTVGQQCLDQCPQNIEIIRCGKVLQILYLPDHPQPQIGVVYILSII